jgi:hypothetical protein
MAPTKQRLRGETLSNVREAFWAERLRGRKNTAAAAPKCRRQEFAFAFRGPRSQARSASAPRAAPAAPGGRKAQTIFSPGAAQGSASSPVAQALFRSPPSETAARPLPPSPPRDRAKPPLPKAPRRSFWAQRRSPLRPPPSGTARGPPSGRAPFPFWPRPPSPTALPPARAPKPPLPPPSPGRPASGAALVVKKFLRKKGAPYIMNGSRPRRERPPGAAKGPPGGGPPAPGPRGKKFRKRLLKCLTT